MILGYFEDGPNLVTLAMNGWGEGEPAWWLNLQAHPQARVQTPATGHAKSSPTPRPDRSEPSCGIGGGHWTRISTATPDADHTRPWSSSNTFDPA